MLSEHEKNLATINLTKEIIAKKNILKYSEQVGNLINNFDHSGIDIFNNEIKKINQNFGVDRKESRKYPFIYFNDDTLKAHYVCDVIPTEEITTLNSKMTLSSLIHNCYETRYNIIELENALDKTDVILSNVENYCKTHKDCELCSYLESIPKEFRFYFGLMK